MTNFRTAAVATLALGAAFAASSASAQVRYAAPVVAGPGYVVPVDEPVVDAVPPNVIGHFTCAMNERHTRLGRMNCGGTHYNYGQYGYDIR